MDASKYRREYVCVFFFAVGTQNVDKSLQSTWGILKSSDRLSRLREHDTSPAEKRDALKCSRVSFRLENEVSGEDDGEAHEIEAQADREVEAITGIDGESPGMDNEVGSLKYYSLLHVRLDNCIFPWMDHDLYHCSFILARESCLGDCIISMDGS